MTLLIVLSVAFLFFLTSSSGNQSPRWSGVILLAPSQSTVIISGHPAYLPTFKFTVQGNLTTKSGTPLPGAPVRLTFFDQTYNTTTDSHGVFQKILTIPADASDGEYNVYASFAPQGTFGPSFNFTSIEVYHETLNVTVKVSAISFSGFGTTLSGTVMSNGSSVGGAVVRATLPWGEFSTKSNAEGMYNLSLPVPPSTFSLSEQVILNFTPAQPYVKPLVKEEYFQTLNPLLIIFPASAVTVGIYELRNLGLLRKRRTSTKDVKPSDDPFSRERQEASEEIMYTSRNLPQDLLSVYNEARAAALQRYGLISVPGQTVRELALIVEEREGESGEGSSLFSSISEIYEDCLYSESFDSRRIDDTKTMLGNLKKSWQMGN